MAKSSFYSSTGVTADNPDVDPVAPENSPLLDPVAPSNISAIEDSKNAAALSEAAAAASAAASATSASSGAASASTATTKASESAASATASSTSAAASQASRVASEAAKVAAETAKTAAETARDAAGASEVASGAAEVAAETAETNAAASAAAALSSKNAAATSATTASTKASEGVTSAAASEASNVAAGVAKVAAETAEANSETAQTASETAKTASEAAKVAAETAETNASTSAATATTQAGIATTKAGEAATSATSAASSATASEAAKDAALAALDNFDDRYLGTKASDPTVDNDGNALVSGALYFNTTADVMKVYEGSSWVSAYASLSGALLSANNLSDVADAAASRTNLGLGTAATTASTDYATAAQGALADSATQPGDLSTVATSGAYSDLSGTPSPFDPNTLATVATTGAYSDLSGTPTLGTAASTAATDYATAAQGVLADTATQPGDLGTAATSAATDFVAVTGDSMTGNLSFGDYTSAVFGNSNDLQIYHDGSDSYVKEIGAGQLILQGAAQVKIQSSATGDDMIKANSGADVVLYHNNASKLATTSTGIDVTGTVTMDGATTSANIIFGDDDKAVFGAGSDLQIYHDGASGTSYILDSGSSDLVVEGTNLRLRATDNTNYFRGVDGAATYLYHPDATNGIKLETTSSGIDVIGTLTATSFSGDGSALTGLPAGYTNSDVDTHLNYSTATTGQVLSYSGSDYDWVDAASGAGGGGSDDIFYENGQNVTTNYTITNGKNAMSAGPITINSGVTVTVGAGETWTVI